MTRIARSVGMICLAVYLIVTGLVALFSLTFAGIGLVLGVLALLAGILLLAGR